MNINYALGIEVTESEEWQTSLSNNSHLIQLELESPPGPVTSARHPLSTQPSSFIKLTFTLLSSYLKQVSHASSSIQFN